MRTWILFGSSVIAIAIRPEINHVDVLGWSVSAVWVILLFVGMFLDVREHLQQSR